MQNNEMDAYILACNCCWRGWRNVQRTYKIKEK